MRTPTTGLATEPITILLALNLRLMCHGLRAALEKEPDTRVVGETSDPDRLAGLMVELRPKVLIVSLPLLGVGGMAALQRLHRTLPSCRLLVLSTHPEEEVAVEALRCGAAGCISAMASAADLIHAVRTVAAHQPYACPAILAQNPRVLTCDAPLPRPRLTPREAEILGLAARGHSSKDIAEALCISPRTVEIHRARGMQKLGLRSYNELIRYALRRGLLCLP